MVIINNTGALRTYNIIPQAPVTDRINRTSTEKRDDNSIAAVEIFY